jgi:hypothetical protein
MIFFIYLFGIVNMKKWLTIVCLSFLQLHCGKKDSYTPAPAGPPVIITTAKNFLALGDSYTIGQSVPEADRFPVQTMPRRSLLLPAGQPPICKLPLLRKTPRALMMWLVY